jgi:hypothetical protein
VTWFTKKNLNPCDYHRDSCSHSRKAEASDAIRCLSHPQKLFAGPAGFRPIVGSQKAFLPVSSMHFTDPPRAAAQTINPGEPEPLVLKRQPILKYPDNGQTTGREPIERIADQAAGGELRHAHTILS